MNGNYPCSADELTKKAANPNSMGSFGQPTGRPMEPRQMNDSNHIQGGDDRAKMGPPSRKTGETTPGY